MVPERRSRQGPYNGFRAGWALEASARFASAYAGLKCEVKGMAKLPVREIRKAAASVDVRQRPQ